MLSSNGDFSNDNIPSQFVFTCLGGLNKTFLETLIIDVGHLLEISLAINHYTHTPTIEGTNCVTYVIDIDKKPSWHAIVNMHECDDNTNRMIGSIIIQVSSKTRDVTIQLVFDVFDSLDVLGSCDGKGTFVSWKCNVFVYYIFGHTNAMRFESAVTEHIQNILKTLSKTLSDVYGQGALDKCCIDIFL